MKDLKHASDALTVLAIVFLVVGVVGPSWAYIAAAVCLVGAIATTVIKRKRSRSRRTAV